MTGEREVGQVRPGRTVEVAQPPRPHAGGQAEVQPILLAELPVELEAGQIVPDEEGGSVGAEHEETAGTDGNVGEVEGNASEELDAP